MWGFINAGTSLTEAAMAMVASIAHLSTASLRSFGASGDHPISYKVSEALLSLLN